MHEAMEADGGVLEGGHHVLEDPQSLRDGRRVLDGRRNPRSSPPRVQEHFPARNIVAYVN